MSEGWKKILRVYKDACLQSHLKLAAVHLLGLTEVNIYIYIKHKFGAQIIRECLNMREMLKTSHLSVLMGQAEPPPTASTHELVNVLHMWDLLMQFRVSPKA